MQSRRAAILAFAPLLVAARRAFPQTLPDANPFLRWYTWLAEAAAFWPGPLPTEITDCSSLVRFAYRNALARHNGAWARSLGLKRAPVFPDVAPASLPAQLRTAPNENAYFADADHLMRFNFRRIAGDVAAARPGDALFWARAPKPGAGHVMIWLGASQFDDTAEPCLVYHTGPEGKWKGEVRRPTLAELQRHPDPRWRPVRGNPAFLGVYRWRFLVA